MPAPAPYTRKANFKNAQALNPSAQTDGTALDSEFNAIKSVLDAVLSRLPFIQRDDARLANQSVGAEQLSPSLSMGFTLRGVWATGVNYNFGDGVSKGTVFYRALAANLSATGNAPDIDSATWEEVADLASIAGAVVHASDAAPDGSAAAPGLGFQSQALGFFKQASGVIGVSIVGVQKFLIGAAGLTLPTDPTAALHAATKQYVDAQIAAAITSSDIGVLKMWPSNAAVPANHVLCYGQPLSRSLPLFSIFGTTFGVGDGSTTFNNIDMRGFVAAGVDNMGGSAAGRLTAATITGGGNAVGNSGGEQQHTLSTAELAAHTHGTTESAHNHGLTDPGHFHATPVQGAALGPGGGGNKYVGGTPNNSDTKTTGITIASATTGLTVNSAGSGTPHNNIQPTKMVNFIVRVQ
jgi:microcystin-dependent protein